MSVIDIESCALRAQFLNKNISSFLNADYLFILVTGSTCWLVGLTNSKIVSDSYTQKSTFSVSFGNLDDRDCSVPGLQLSLICFNTSYESCAQRKVYRIHAIDMAGSEAIS